MKQSKRPKGTLLIVDDNPQHLLALTQMLTAQGYEIRPANNGHIALNILPTILPDLILLDILMPGIDGYEVCRRLKAADATRAIPVIFLRALDETLDKIKAFDAGGVDYITKPFQAEEVLARVETHLALRKTQEELKKQHDHLEERVEERTAELTIANEQLHQEIAGRKKVEQALRESEMQYRLLFENLQDLFFRVNTDGVILLVSPSIILLLGYLPETVIGTQITETVFASPEQWQTLLTTLTHQGHTEGFEILLKHANGPTLWGSATSYIYAEQEGRHIIEGTIRDVTKRKQAEEELLAAHNELKHSLESLRMAQNHLVEVEKMAALGMLVAGVAHEINTPVGVGVTAASHLEQKTRTFKNLYQENRMTRSDMENYLNTAIDSTDIILRNLLRAAEQIRNFKQVAVDQSSSETRQFNLKTYIDGLLISLHPELKRTHHKVTVHCPEDLEIFSYPGAFSQLLTNLILNSLIHGFEGIDRGEIVLEITQAPERLQLHYRDNGKGITEDAQRHIFEPFYTTKREQGSSGLGLYIVYNLVTQKLGGAIRCESAPGGGTTFVIQIPLNC